MIGDIKLVSRLHWRRWGDEWIVFSTGSGHTHKLEALSATLLLICEEGPVAFPRLLEQVAAELAVAPDQDTSDALTRIVEQCESLGLLERVEE